MIRVRPGQPPFMQKNVPKYTPDWVQPRPALGGGSKREVSYALCNDRRTLLWFANQRAVEYHPTLVRADDWEHQTHLVLDLDPPRGARRGFRLAVRAAQLVAPGAGRCRAGRRGQDERRQGRARLRAADRARRSGDVAAATRAIAARAERLDRDLATTAFISEERHGKVFLDSTRAGGATVVAAYSPRMRPGVPVSFPVAWDDLDRGDAGRLHHPHRRLTCSATGSWAERMPEPQTLPADLIEEGHAIPIARVQAMHEGKRRARGPAQRPTRPEPADFVRGRARICAACSSTRAVSRP